MAIVPFRTGRRQASQPPPSDLAGRFRNVVDAVQRLALSKPLVAVWLVEWLELFLKRHLE